MSVLVQCVLVCVQCNCVWCVEWGVSVCDGV